MNPAKRNQRAKRTKRRAAPKPTRHNLSRFGTVPGTGTALLSAPTKMPGLAFGLPAHDSCPRQNGDICKSCYASQGRYALWPAIRSAQFARFDWIKRELKAGRAAEVTKALIDAIRKGFRKLPKSQRYFRIHDSGDFFHPEYIRVWIDVARALPLVKFWAPTRVWQRPVPESQGLFRIVGQHDPFMAALLELAALPNVTVRPSALNFGGPPPVIPGLAAGAGADHPDLFHESTGTLYQCPARSQGNNCGTCRVCWDAPEVPVSYHRH